MQYIEAVNSDNINNKLSLFLAGGITGTHNWQKDFIEKVKDLEITIINPRRSKDFDWNDKNVSSEQIKWEHKFIRKANLVLFWFPPETLCPIALFELGATLERWKFNRKQVLFIGCDKDYQRKFDIIEQLKNQEYEYPLYENLDDLANLVKEVNNFLNPEKKLIIT